MSLSSQPRCEFNFYCYMYLCTSQTSWYDFFKHIINNELSCNTSKYMTNKITEELQLYTFSYGVHTNASLHNIYRYITVHVPSGCTQEVLWHLQLTFDGDAAWFDRQPCLPLLTYYKLRFSTYSASHSETE